MKIRLGRPKKRSMTSFSSTRGMPNATASISLDLGDMWHHGYLVSSPWDGELELDSASDCDNASGAMEKGL